MMLVSAKSLPLMREVAFAKQKTEGEKKGNSLPQLRSRSAALCGGPSRWL